MKKLEDENKTGLKTKYVSFRCSEETAKEIRFLQKFYPQWTTGKILRACIASTTAMHKGVRK